MRAAHESSWLDLNKCEDTGDVDRDFEINPIALSNRSLAGYNGPAVPDGSQVKYGVLASVLLHVLIFAWFVRQIEAVPNRTLLKPGENLTNVRLIEQPIAKEPEEQPPQHSQAISDRNHTAAIERIPRIPGSLTPPLGKIEAPTSRMASRMPPSAPEDVTPMREDGKAKTSPPKNLDEEQKDSRSRQKARTPVPQNSSPRNPSKQIPDLKPTPREQQIAAGLSPYQHPHTGSPDFSPDGDPDEAVVDINTREEKFFSYLLHLKQKIQGVWVYPSSAARAGIGGSLTVEFSVSRNGELLYVNLLDSSGHAILDESALRAIRVAAPYFPFPPRMTAKRLKIRANFVYITGDYFRRIL